MPYERSGIWGEDLVRIELIIPVASTTNPADILLRSMWSQDLAQCLSIGHALYVGGRLNRWVITNVFCASHVLGGNWLIFSSLILSLLCKLPSGLGCIPKRDFFYWAVWKPGNLLSCFQSKCEPLLRKYFELVDSWILFLNTTLWIGTFSYFSIGLVNVYAVVGTNLKLTCFIITQVPPCG